MKKLYKALLVTIVRSLLKLLFGFRHGLVYGYKNAKLISIALCHFVMGKTGSLNSVHE